MHTGWYGAHAVDSWVFGFPGLKTQMSIQLMLLLVGTPKLDRTPFYENPMPPCLFPTSFDCYSLWVFRSRSLRFHLADTNRLDKLGTLIRKQYFYANQFDFHCFSVKFAFFLHLFYFDTSQQDLICCFMFGKLL